MAALSLGAEGIEMGTRFIATKDCVHAHEAYKRSLVEGTESDTVVIKRTLGAPGRAIVNSWTEKILEIERKNGDYEQLKSFISGEANKRYIYDGETAEGFAWAGQVMGMIKDVPTVAELLNRMKKEAEQIRAKWGK
jgi:enoyl-[acyl-carrier protein] reductase II